MRGRAYLLLAALFFISPDPELCAASAAALYNRGNDLYQLGQYEKARDAYIKALETGIEAPDLYYNLANAHLRSGDLGRAVAFYLKAERLAPRDLDVKFNLEYARRKVAAKLPDLPQGPFSRAFNAAVGFLSANEWTLVIVCAYWVACISAAVMVLVRSGWLAGAFRVALVAGAAIFILSLPFAGARVKRDFFTTTAVIMADKVAARSGPSDDNAALFDLYEGMEVRVDQCESGWCRVSAKGGFMGWVSSESFEKV